MRELGSIVIEIAGAAHRLEAAVLVGRVRGNRAVESSRPVAPPLSGRAGFHWRLVTSSRVSVMSVLFLIVMVP